MAWIGSASSSRALACKQPLAFVSQVSRCGRQNPANHERGDTVHNRHVEELAEQDSEKGYDQAKQGCGILE